MTCADNRHIIAYAPCIGDCTKCKVRSRAVIYGPVKSRRRGLSLGVNFFPRAKVCSFDCVYCIRGKTIVKTLLAYSSYQISPRQITKFLEIALQKVRADTVDLSGNGEPTLYPRFIEAVRDIYKICLEYSIKSLGIFTNSTALARRYVRHALRYIDHVEAKLDVANDLKLGIINRPVHGITIEKIVHNIKSVRKYVTSLIIQTLVCDVLVLDRWVRSIESSEIEQFVKILLTIDPDEVYLYTAYRPSLGTRHVRPVSREDIRQIADVLSSHGLKVRVFI